MQLRVSKKTHADLFELKCAWRLQTFDDTIQKLIKKAKNDCLFVGEEKPKKEGS